MQTFSRRREQDGGNCANAVCEASRGKRVYAFRAARAEDFGAFLGFGFALTSGTLLRLRRYQLAPDGVKFSLIDLHVAIVASSFTSQGFEESRKIFTAPHFRQIISPV